MDRYGEVEVQIYNFPATLNEGVSSALHPRECGRHFCGQKVGRAPEGKRKIFTPLGMELRFSSPSLSPYTYFRQSKVTRQMTKTQKIPYAGYEVAIALRRRCKFLLILTFQTLAVSLRTTRFSIQQFYMVLALRSLFCTDLKRDSDFCFIQVGSNMTGIDFFL